jgi:cellulose synthase/poly-beta-1,6-N-acetylglucosamine synthase-like glycosyltransferase
MIVGAALFLLISLLGCVYPYFGYPLLLALRARRRTLKVRTHDIEPTVTIIIPVYNRENTIAQKLHNTLALEYPADKLEIIVVSDGSTDRTDAIVNSIQDPRIRLLSLPRSGRLVALQQGGRRARGEILAFSDPAVAVDPGALRHLVRNFADRFVGGVCAASKVRRSRSGDATSRGEAIFTHLEAWIKRLESKTGSVYAADSGFFAMRRALFVPPRNLAQADDIAISARIVLGNHRLVYEPRAVCRRETPADGARDFRRRTHIVNYTIRALIDVKWQLVRNRTYGVQVLSHTLARYLVPFFAAGVLLSTATLTSYHPAFAYALAAQQTVILFALLGWRLRASAIGRFPLLAIPCYLAMYHIAGVLGLLSVVRGFRPVGATPRAARAAMANEGGA